MRRQFLLAVSVSLPLFAQLNLSGVWASRVFDEDGPQRFDGLEPGDYGGIPLNAAARLRADSWNASLLTLPEYQCRVIPSDYGSEFADIRIWEEIARDTQQLIAIHLHHFAFGTERIIWMDGRPHPPDYALHSAMGFSTGKWTADTLVVTTTHLKEGWTRSNGIPRSDRATITEHFIRHGDHLTWVTFIEDPAYLTEPFIRSRDYTFSVAGQIAPYPCESAVEIVRPKGVIPHYLPGTNPFLTEYAVRHGIPEEATRGGAETMYPEYETKTASMPRPQGTK